MDPPVPNDAFWSPCIKVQSEWVLERKSHLVARAYLYSWRSWIYERSDWITSYESVINWAISYFEKVRSVFGWASLYGVYVLLRRCYLSSRDLHYKPQARYEIIELYNDSVSPIAIFLLLLVYVITMIVLQTRSTQRNRFFQNPSFNEILLTSLLQDKA